MNSIVEKDNMFKVLKKEEADRDFVSTSASKSEWGNYGSQYIYASFEKLTEIFGPPTYIDQDKSYLEWDIQVPHGRVTVYDYREAIHPKLYPDRKFSWHVGASSLEALKVFIAWYNSPVREVVTR